MPIRFASRAYDAPGDLAAAKQAMHDTIQASEDGGSVCVRDEGQFTEHIFFAKHSCTREIDGLYGTFSVCCDLKADSGMKGTLVFSCFDACFAYMHAHEARAGPVLLRSSRLGIGYSAGSGH